MQATKNSIISVIILFISVLVTSQVNGGAYQFPIKSGTPEWKALKTHAEMLEVLQIPETILKKISTEELIETCMNYPLYGDMLAYENLQKGIEAVIEGFNGLQELLKREDAGSELFLRYTNMDPEALKESWTPVRKGEHASKLSYMELLLAQDVILSKLSKADRPLLISETIRKFRAKQADREVYGIISTETIAFLMGRTLLIENDAKFVQRISRNKNLDTFLKSSLLTNGDTISEIVSCAEHYLKIKK